MNAATVTGRTVAAVNDILPTQDRADLDTNPAANANASEHGDGKFPTNPSILDTTWLFRFSGLCDQVRDAARFLVEEGCDARDALQPLAERYLELRARLPEVLGELEAPQTTQWGYAVDPAVVSAAGLYAASAMLSRWCDLLYQTPAFVTQQKIALMSVEKASREIDAVLRNDLPVPSADGSERGGTYL